MRLIGDAARHGVLRGAIRPHPSPLPHAGEGVTSSPTPRKAGGRNHSFPADGRGHNHPLSPGNGGEGWGEGAGGALLNFPIPIVDWAGRIDMRTRCTLVAGLAAALLAGCAGTGDTSSRVTFTVPLQAARIVAGEVGEAQLIPQGESTDVRIVVSGVPRALSSPPVHLYTFIHDGKCGNLSAQPAYALLDRVLAQSLAGGRSTGGPFTISNTAPLAMERLRTGGYALVVRTSPADGNREIFCGDIR
jgi:hypothetical protein